LCTRSLTSDGLLGYLADVHRNGGCDAAEAGAGDQTRHVQMPDVCGEVNQWPADDERQGQEGDDGFSAD